MFEQIFKNIDDVLWKEAGCTTELDYIEQTSWILFLKYLDDFERERARRMPVRDRLPFFEHEALSTMRCKLRGDTRMGLEAANTDPFAAGGRGY